MNHGKKIVLPLLPSLLSFFTRKNDHFPFQSIPFSFFFYLIITRSLTIFLKIFFLGPYFSSLTKIGFFTPDQAWFRSLTSFLICSLGSSLISELKNWFNIQPSWNNDTNHQYVEYQIHVCFWTVVFRKSLSKLSCVCLLLEKLINGKYFPVKEKFGLVSRKVFSCKIWAENTFRKLWKN